MNIYHVNTCVGAGVLSSRGLGCAEPVRGVARGSVGHTDERGVVHFMLYLYNIMKCNVMQEECGAMIMTE
jgi:hypothetical protein